MLEDKLIKLALHEDKVTKDLTSYLIPEKNKCHAVIVFKESGICAGLNLAKKVFKTSDHRSYCKSDGRGPGQMHRSRCQ